MKAYFFNASCPLSPSSPPPPLLHCILPLLHPLSFAAFSPSFTSSPSLHSPPPSLPVLVPLLYYRLHSLSCLPLITIFFFFFLLLLLLFPSPTSPPPPHISPPPLPSPSYFSSLSISSYLSQISPPFLLPSPLLLL